MKLTVVSGKTFYNSSRTQATGTKLVVSNCPTQQWHDSHASATQGNNCNVAWGANVSVTGAEKKDPVTGLIWSNLLINNAGTVAFSAGSNSTWSWDGTTDADNIAVGGKTAALLCSERGDSWRLPTEKELMQAYIDGSFWNLTQPSYGFWSLTEYSAANAWYVSLYSGFTGNNSKTSSYQVRCVR